MHFRVLVDLLSSFDLGFLESFFFSSWPSGISGSCSDKTKVSNKLSLSPPSLHTNYDWTCNIDYSFCLESSYAQHSTFYLTCNIVIYYSSSGEFPRFALTGYITFQKQNLSVQAIGSLCLCCNSDIMPGLILLVYVATEHLYLLSTGISLHSAVFKKFHVG